LGIWGDPARTGKPVFGDLREGKRTLPVIAALTAGVSASERLGALFERGVRSDFELRLAADLVEEAGGREFAEGEAARHLAEVDSCLASLAMPAETRAAFDSLAQSLIGRSR